MKREILFRGKRKDGKGFDYGDLRQTNEGYYISSNTSRQKLEPVFTLEPITPETIGQFTGLTDKNGVKIFEGDVLKGGIYIRYVVEWDSYNCEFTIHAFNVDLFEIIGNIHEND